MHNLLSCKMRPTQLVMKAGVGRHCAALHIRCLKLQLHKQVQNSLEQHVATVCIMLYLSAQMQNIKQLMLRQHGTVYAIASFQLQISEYRC